MSIGCRDRKVERERDSGKEWKGKLVKKIVSLTLETFVSLSALFTPARQIDSAGTTRSQKRGKVKKNTRAHENKSAALARTDET